MSIHERIKQRRKQMIVHSIIYYKFGTSVIPDSKFDRWALELKELQEQYPDVSKEVQHYEYFKDWDATTGYHLIGLTPYIPVAEWLIEYHSIS